MIVGYSRRKVYVADEYPKVLSMADGGFQQSRVRPAIGGVSIGPAGTKLAGTLGASVFDAATRRKLFLSNWHVMVLDNSARLGSPIIQPGALDGGTYPDDLFGKLERFAELSPGDNLIDAALGEPLDPGDLYNDVYGVGFVTGWTEPYVGMPVVLSCRDGIAEGTVTDVGATFYVSGYPWGRSTFHDQFVMEPAIEHDGASGGLIVDRNTGLAAGLAFAGNSGFSLANRMANVNRILGIAWG